IARDEDLVLHLPLRYEDHTRLVPLADVKVGETLQTEGTVVNVDIQYRPRRQLVVLLEDGPSDGGRARLVLRFFSFYPNYQKALDARTHPAWTRLKFDELVAQQLSLKMHRAARAKRNAPILTGTGSLAKQLLQRVGFKLTRAQEKVGREIAHDLKRSMPMQRL